MSRFSISKLTQEQQAELRTEFYNTIASLNGRDEIELFLQDLLTLDEIAMLMRRIEVATLLRAGFSYTQITDILGVGKDKITNVQRVLQRNNSGYDIIIRKLLKTRQLKGAIKESGVKSKNSEYERLKRIPYSGLYLLHVIDQISELLETKFDDGDLSKKDQEILSRMPTRRSQ